MINMRVCPIHEFISCSLDNIVTEEFKRTGNGCVAEIATKMMKESPKKYYALKEDNEKLGWNITHITDSILRFEEELKDGAIFRGENQEIIYTEEMKNGNFWLNPFIIKEDIVREENFHIRGSEFHSKCPLQILFSTLKEDIRGNTDYDIALSGSARHEIASGDCNHGKHIKRRLMRKLENSSNIRDKYLKKRRNKTRKGTIANSLGDYLDRFDISPIFYSEKTVEYVLELDKVKVDIPKNERFFNFSDMILPDKIILRGTADYIFHVANKKNSIVIWDNKRYKHRFYEKNSTKYQMLGYALGVNQFFNMNAEEFYLITEHRPGIDKQGNIGLPKFHGTIIKSNSKFIDEFHTEMLRHYLIKTELAKNPEKIEEIMNYMRNNTTKNNKNYCRTLYSGIGCILYNTCENIIENIKSNLKTNDVNSLFITPLFDNS